MNRRSLLKSLSLLPFTGLAAARSFSLDGEEVRAKPLVIDTHLEPWTFNPQFPFNHPEAGKNIDVKIEAPIENQVAQMKDFGLKYAVLINPRYYGWDNSYIAHCVKTYPKLFVGHGLLQPEDPKIADNLRYWIKERGLAGFRFSPIYHPKSTWLNSPEHYPLWKEAEKWEQFLIIILLLTRCRCWKIWLADFLA